MQQYRIRITHCAHQARAAEYTAAFVDIVAATFFAAKTWPMAFKLEVEPVAASNARGAR